ncbi:MAG: DUF3298 domain-containing protein [Ferruginibacter sp.]|nr:DUF3298 domain-containing protein [Ferruginibacter sp.]
MQIKALQKNVLTALLLLSLSTSIATAQSLDGWYKVFTGPIGNFTATLHLHKSAKNYSGYIWFLQHQWPMQLYYNTPSIQTDSLVISAGSGPMSIVLSGVLNNDSFNGICEISKDNGTAKQASFELRASIDDTYTPFNYYYTEGFAKLSPQFNNHSECSYIASSIWPVNNNKTDEVYKNEIRQMFDIKTPVAEIGGWLIDEKNRYVSVWKKENGKLSPKEAADLGLSLTLQEEVRVLVMYENEKHITIAQYNAGYTGGAHGSFATSLTTFNKQTGKKLKLSDVVNAAGIQLLPMVLDQVARQQYNIKNNKPLDQNGFLVRKISPNQNFYLTGDGIGFMYAPYAIKSFADGEINLLVPFATLKAYLLPGIVAK